MDPVTSLMLGGIVAACPDCGDEQILVEAGPGEYCCTGCDAAVILLEVLMAPSQVALRRRAAS